MLEPSLQTLEGGILMSPIDARNVLGEGPLFQFPSSLQLCVFTSSVLQPNLQLSKLPGCPCEWTRSRGSSCHRGPRLAGHIGGAQRGPQRPETPSPAGGESLEHNCMVRRVGAKLHSGR